MYEWRIDFGISTTRGTGDVPDEVESVEGDEDAIVAARALGVRGEDLVAGGSYAAGLDVFREIVERFGRERGSELRELVATALVRQGLCLRELGRGGVIACYDEVVKRFGRDREARVCERVAEALVDKASALDGLGRHQEAIAVCDEVVARYSGVEDEATLEHVARALYGKAITVGDLGQTAAAVRVADELINRFDDAIEPMFRWYVTWGLSQKLGYLGELERTDEAAVICDLLICRYDEELDADFADDVAWCLERKASMLGDSGEADQQLAVYDDLISRFGASDDPSVRLRVAGAFAMQAYVLCQLGRQDEQFAVTDELVARFGAAPETEVRGVAAERLGVKASMLERAGHTDQALAAHDEALSMLASDADAVPSESFVKALYRKSALLCFLKRHAEAVLVFDNATTAYLDLLADQPGAKGALEQAAVALHQWVYSLCMLERTTEIETVRDRLMALLGDVREASADAAPAQLEPLPEREIARVLAELLDGDCWVTLATSTNDPRSWPVLVDRAVALYRRTESWLRTDPGTWGTPPFAAVMLLRQFADCYAMLARWRSPENRAGLPLINRPVAEWALRHDGVDDWAAEQGHPLDLRESPQEVDELIEDQRAAARDTDPEFAAAFVAAIWQRDLLRVLCDSERGRGLLHGDEFRAFAASRVGDARRWGAAAWVQHEEAMGAGPARQFVAQAYFVACNSVTPSSAELFPSPAVIRGFLRQVDGYDWLNAENLPLPPWLAQHQHEE